MEGRKYAGVLRSRSRLKGGASSSRSSTLSGTPSDKTQKEPVLIVDGVSEYNLCPLIQRMIAELERPQLIEVHCISLESIFTPRVLSLIREACRDNGVFYVTGHGISSNLLEDMQRLASIFFSLPPDVKEQCSAANVLASNSRYEHNAAAKKESLQIDCEPSVLSEIDWPTEPPIFSKVLAKYLVEHQQLAAKVLQLVSRSLGLSENGLISACFEPFTSMTIHQISPDPDVMSIAQNTVQNGRQYSSVLTMTLPDDTGGLQIWSKDRWMDVKPCEGAILISVGDQLQDLSDGKYKSNLHRIVASKCAGRMFTDVNFCASTEAIADLAHFAPAPSHRMECE